MPPDPDRRVLPEFATSIRSNGGAPRVGVFGLLGSGNLGNDASFEVVLRYLRAEHPHATVDAMCMGPAQLKQRYGIDAVPLQSYRERALRTSRVKAIFIKIAGKGVDTLRTAAWTRRHDVVIVPGMGVLETSLPLRATGVPYALFLLSAFGRLFSTKVALVSVGATVVNQRPTRWLFNTAAGLAYYRSYRDAPSLEAMRRRGIDQPGDRVYPDLVFALPVPDDGLSDPKTVGVGVMAYSGGNDDRSKAQAIHEQYVRAMLRFSGWLVDSGYRIRFFGGDPADQVVVDQIMADLRSSRPELDPDSVVAVRCSSMHELMDEMSNVGTAVCTRYHNVVAALKLSKPTIAIAYSTKHTALMADMGMPEFARPARSLDADDLIAQFEELELRAPQLRRDLLERNVERRRELDEQFKVLSSRVLSRVVGKTRRSPRAAGARPDT